LRPSIPQCNCPVEHWFCGSGILVHTEVPQPLELVTRSGRGVRNAWLDVAYLNVERVRVQVVQVSLTFYYVVRVGRLEEVVVKPDFSFSSGWRGDPVEGGFDLSSIRRISSAGCRIVGTAKLRNISVGIFDDLIACDEVAVSEPDFPAGGQAKE